MAPPGTPTARQILGRSSLLAGLPPQWLDRLAEHAILARYEKGRVIFRQGDPCPGLFCVGTGLVRIFQLSPSGKALVLHFAGPGRTFAEVAAFGQFPVPANAEALEDTLCALLPTAPLRGLLEQHHDLCLGLLGSMSAWVRGLVGLLEDLVLRDATGRVARHLLEASEADRPFALAVRKKDLAAHLGLTSETFSRTLRKLLDDGLIESVGREEMRVLDRERLEGLAAGLEA